METKMRKSIGTAAVVALTMAAIAAWANASIRRDAATQMLGPMAVEAQIDATELTKTALNLPVQKFDAY